MGEIAYDIEGQLETVRAGLLEGEVLYAVYDGKGTGTGFVGISDLRVILQDESLVGGKVALVSLPYKRIYSVSLLSNKSFLGGFVEAATLGITVSSKTYEVELRGHEKAKHAHDLIVHFVTRG